MLEGIGPKIKEAREEINISQKDLGMSLGLSDKAVSAYESSRTIPPIETLARIADELNKPIDFFLSSKPQDYSLETKLSLVEKGITRLTKELESLKQTFLGATGRKKTPAENPVTADTPEQTPDK